MISITDANNMILRFPISTLKSVEKTPTEVTFHFNNNSRRTLIVPDPTGLDFNLQLREFENIKSNGTWK